MRTKRINPTPEQLSIRERAAIDFIEAHIATARFSQSPSTEEIRAAIGMSLGATHDLLQRLLAWGYLSKRSKHSTKRNLRVARSLRAAH